MKRIFLILLLILGTVSLCFATHNRAGEITYKKVEPADPTDFRYEITITTCTKASAPADRPYLNIRFGDEAEGAPIDSIARTLADPPVGIISPDDFRINQYVTVHTYPGAGTYLISMEDPNRNGGVINMDESISQPFYIETLLVINPFLGFNNSVQLLYPAKDRACLNSVWEHNPGAFDVDGDSLVYKLVSCRGLDGEDIPSWVLPNEIEIDGIDNIDDTFDLNEVTGTITWDSPGLAGEYNMAIRIEEYRDGFLIGYVVRDMQIEVLFCANDPPIVTQFNDTCITIGEVLNFEVEGVDAISQVSLEAVGGPLTEVVNTATFSSTSGNPATGEFTWAPDCEEVRPGAYQVLFRGEDSSNEFELVDISELSIQVIAPPVENITVTPNGLGFDVEWDDYFCNEVVAYKIYQRTGASGFVPGFCETGVPDGIGYDLIATISSEETTYYDDEEIDFGIESCYIIVACFDNGSESIASEEVCNSIDLIIPVITKASIGVTDAVAGVDTVHWAPPITEDTLLLTAPYTYKLYHSPDNTNEQELILETPTSPFIATLPRTFIHQNINTVDLQHGYQVVLEDALGNVLSSAESTTVFLNLIQDDNELTLDWSSTTSWENNTVEVFKLNQETDEFEFLASTEEDYYVDTGLVNNVEYCYYVKTLGSLNSSLDVLPNPVLNLSQQVCSSPVDLTSPCPPELTGEGDCETATVSFTWNNPNESCADDVTSYQIYFKPFTDAEYELLTTIDDPTNTTFEYVNEENITGCFYMTALDSILPGIGGVPNQNESLPSLEICTESCPEYELPNVFSPQGDSFNDAFRPFPYRYVDSIDMVIYNRWGTPVFETTDPDINWKGENMDTGDISSDGVYFYTIKVYTTLLTGVREEEYSGNISLFDGQKQSSN